MAAKLANKMDSRETTVVPAQASDTTGFIIQDDKRVACHGLGLKNMLQAGEQWLGVHRQIVDGLNVFPVPDGDTGTNMLLTMHAALEQVEQVGIDPHAETVAAAAAQGALLGARGNSGVILSQLLQGLADGLRGKVSFSLQEFADAIHLGAEQAYQSVVEPVEGTILTVAAAAAEAARHSALSRSDFVTFMVDIVEAARVAQAQTPELLPVLKEAGVTDSGGQGLLYILEGALRFLQDEPVSEDPTEQTSPKLRSGLGVDDRSFGYDVQFLIRGERLEVAQIRARIDSMGSSTVVVGDEQTVKVHVHVNDPDLPLKYGASQGHISDIVVENLAEQARAFVRENLAPLNGTDSVVRNGVAVISVVSGDGLADIFRSLGANKIVSGGQSMNPSTRELLNAVERIGPENVLILPNNDNIILAAQQVTKLSRKNVGVVPTKTIPQGIAALLSFDDRVDVGANVQRMSDAGKQVHTFELTTATRDTSFNGFTIKAGDVLGLYDGDIVSVGADYQEVVLAALARVEFGEFDIITIYYGQDSSPGQADILAAKIGALYPEVDIEVYFGGQPHYNYIISLE